MSRGKQAPRDDDGTKVKDIERVKRGEKMVDVTLTYNIIESIVSMILKNTEYMKFVVPVFSTIVWKTCGR